MNAKEILMKAVQCDREGRILEAERNYMEGIKILAEILDDETDVAKKKVFYERIQEYIDRREQIKERVEKHLSQGELVSHVAINENDTGCSYQTIFGKYITADLKEVLLEEPYMAVKHHFYNLIMFCELLVKQSKNFKFISLITKRDTDNPSNQLKMLEQIQEDLAKRNISLSFTFQYSLHDRKIVLSNGYIIKIGRGLHIFKPVHPLFSLGLFDHDFRKCLQTDVDIWRTKCTY